MAITEQRITLEAFLKLPEKKPALEFEDGVVTQKVPPQGKHVRLQDWLVELVNAHGKEPKLALAFSELRVTFDGLSRVPDVSIYRWERIPRDPDGEVANEFRVPPDVAIEIVSPGQRPNALVRRCLWYVSHGVGTALLIDPLDRTALQFRADIIPLHLQGEDRIDFGDLLPGFELRVRDVFAGLVL
jgi:Uma2 family endonuclease